MGVILFPLPCREHPVPDGTDGIVRCSVCTGSNWEEPRSTMFVVLAAVAEFSGRKQGMCSRDYEAKGCYVAFHAEPSAFTGYTDPGW